MSADPSRASFDSRLAFHGPLSDERSARLTRELTAKAPATERVNPAD